jgi:hypothetical protein
VHGINQSFPALAKGMIRSWIGDRRKFKQIVKRPTSLDIRHALKYQTVGLTGVRRDSDEAAKGAWVYCRWGGSNSRNAGEDGSELVVVDQPAQDESVEVPDAAPPLRQPRSRWGRVLRNLRRLLGHGRDEHHRVSQNVAEH